MTQFEKWYKDTVKIASVKTRNINTEDMQTLIRMAYEEILTKVPHNFYWDKYKLKNGEYISIGKKVNSNDIELGVEVVVNDNGNKIDYDIFKDNYKNKPKYIYKLKKILKPMEECEIDILYKIRDTIIQYIGLTLFESTSSSKGAERYQMAERRYKNTIQELKDSVPEHMWKDNVDNNTEGRI